MAGHDDRRALRRQALHDIGLTPLYHAMPDGLATVPLTDMPPSRLVVAWDPAAGPLVRSFARLCMRRI